MDYLRQGIHLRGYAQKDPKQEYKRESFSMFAAMLESLKYEVVSTLSKVQVRMPEEVEELEQQRRMEAERLAQMQQLSHQDDDTAAAAALAAQTGIVKWVVMILARVVLVKIQAVPWPPAVIKYSHIR